jgi:hypothetical protein
LGSVETSTPSASLSDNASAYIAENTLDIAMGLNLCFIHSSSFAGIKPIAEAFVKTFKRDYDRLSI